MAKVFIYILFQGPQGKLGTPGLTGKSGPKVISRTEGTVRKTEKMLRKYVEQLILLY